VPEVLSAMSDPGYGAEMQVDRAPVPSPLTPLLGRDRELEDARAVLEAQRLLTVVGPGGCGKTRLAVEVAAGAADAVFVDLSPVSDAGLVLPTVARALGLSEAGARPLLVTMRHHLRDRDESSCSTTSSTSSVRWTRSRSPGVAWWLLGNDRFEHRWCRVRPRSRGGNGAGGGAMFSRAGLHPRPGRGLRSVGCVAPANTVVGKWG
jgi:hypothetical protein